jgi:hypothetical protein
MTPLRHIRSVFLLPFLALVACQSSLPDNNALPDNTPIVIGFRWPADPVTFTNGQVLIDLNASSGRPDRVEVLANDTVIGEFAGQALTWQTQSVPEGSYVLRIRALKGTKSFEMTDTRTVQVDRTPPRMTFSPAHGARTVPMSSPITVQFSEPVRAVSRDDVVLRYQASNGTQLTLSFDTVSLSADRRTLTLTRATTLDPDSDFTVELKRVLDDTGNTASVANGAWSWHVPAWIRAGEPISAQTGATDASRPKLAANANGVWLAWEEGGKVYVRRWSGTAWEDRGNLPDSGSGSAPTLALDSSGNLYVALVDASASPAALRVFRSGPAGWVAVGASISRAAAANPALALDGTGAPVLAAEGNDGTAISIYAWRYTQAGGWQLMTGTPASAKTGASPAGKPALLFDSQGAGWLAFEEADASRSDVYLWKWNGTDWRDAESGAVNYPDQAIQPSLAMGYSNNLYLALIKGGSAAVYDRSLGGGGSWNALSPRGTYPVIADGGLFTMAVDDGSGAGHVEIRQVASDAQFWSALPDRDGPSASLRPTLVLTPNGYFAAWSRSSSNARDVYVYRSNFE